MNTNSGKCLDVQADDPNNGTVVQLYDCNGTNAQRWNPTVIGAASGGGSSSGGSSAGGSSSGGGSSGLAQCTSAQLAECNCPSSFSCCPTDGSCFQDESQIVYTMCKNDPSLACSMSGASSSSPSPSPTPAPTPTPTPAPSSNGQRTFLFVNQCGYDVWVGGEGNPISPSTPCSAGCPSGLGVQHGEPALHVRGPQRELAARVGSVDGAHAPAVVGRSLRPRTECTASGSGVTCATGDCGGNLACPVGVGGAPPATLAEFTVMPPSAGTDYYDVSNVDGANVPLSIVPTAGTFQLTPPAGANGPYYCGSPGSPSGSGGLAGCSWNLEAACPAELQDTDPGHYVGCRSAGQVCAVIRRTPR